MHKAVEARERVREREGRGERKREKRGGCAQEGASRVRVGGKGV